MNWMNGLHSAGAALVSVSALATALTDWANRATITPRRSARQQPTHNQRKETP